MASQPRSSIPIDGTLGQQKTRVLYLSWTGGGAAANGTLSAAEKKKGLQSVVYNSATGKFVLTLSENYVEYLGLTGHVLDATAVQQSLVVADSCSLTASGGTTINIGIYSSASGAAMALYDPLTTEKVYCTVVMGLSSVNA